MGFMEALFSQYRASQAGREEEAQSLIEKGGEENLQRAREIQEELDKERKDEKDLAITVLKVGVTSLITGNPVQSALLAGSDYVFGKMKPKNDHAVPKHTSDKSDKKPDKSDKKISTVTVKLPKINVISSKDLKKKKNK
jgi:hypothetical protein